MGYLIYQGFFAVKRVLRCRFIRRWKAAGDVENSVRLGRLLLTWWNFRRPISDWSDVWRNHTDKHCSWGWKWSKYIVSNLPTAVNSIVDGRWAISDQSLILLLHFRKRLRKTQRGTSSRDVVRMNSSMDFPSSSLLRSTPNAGQRSVIWSEACPHCCRTGTRLLQIGWSGSVSRGM